MRYSALSMALAGPVAIRAASGTGQTTRYWDCCKPSCAWDGKADVSAPVLTCDANDNPLSDDSLTSGCDGGTAYTCSNNSPWAVNDNLAYGFAATKISGGSESSWCCACYALTFTSGAVQGKTMIVQSTNTGSDLGDNHFDLLMPGGGVGIFDGCTSEFGTALPGDQYGGISSESQCSSFPAVLQDGCDWRFDWFENADNPSVSFEQVQCPTALTDISGCIRDDDGDYPVFSASGSSGSSSTSAAAVASSSQAASSAQAVSSQAASSQVASSEVASSQAVSQTASSKASTTTAPQQTDVVESQTSAVQSETTVQAEAPTTELAQTSTSQGLQTRTRASSKASGCAARKSTALGSSTPKASDTAVSAASVSTSTVAIYHQCNGSKDLFPSGALPCASGSTCVYSNDYYSQCQPN